MTGTWWDYLILICCASNMIELVQTVTIVTFAVSVAVMITYRFSQFMKHDFNGPSLVNHIAPGANPRPPRCSVITPSDQIGRLVENMIAKAHQVRVTLLTDTHPRTPSA